MYKLLSLIFLLLIILTGSAKHLDLSIYQNGFYIKYEFPRFAEKSWFTWEYGTPKGLTGRLHNLHAQKTITEKPS